MLLRRSFRVLLIMAGALIVVGVIGVVSVVYVPAPLERALQARVERALRQHFHRDVRLQSMHVTLVPVFRVTADNFVLPNRDKDQPPFIAIKHFVAVANPLELLRAPIHVTSLKLDGLVINIAPKGAQPPEEANHGPAKRPHLANFVIDRVVADGTLLYILPKNPDRDAMEFEIQKLSLKSAGLGQPMTFQAELTNPKPPGIIHSTGKFGPWNMDEPAQTPVAGHYTFDEADLGIFNGISGILSSIGDYNGQLDNILVDGTTDTPDFQLDRGARAVHLKTKFHAIVDGTSGNTYLQPVDASFLNSHVIAKGEVAGKKGQKGKTIRLDIDIHDSHVEDMLALATAKGNTLLTGKLLTQARLVLPPGDQAVLDKMSLAGRFRVKDGHFTDKDVQSKIDGLSRRGQGKPNIMEIQNVPAQFKGTFLLQNAKMRFSELNFQVPGVTVQMKGSYSIPKEELDFAGDVRLHATVSHTMTGPKRWIVVPFDPLFKRKGAGTYLPVHVEGTPSKPQIKLDWKKIL
jgi:hypothetical protein